MPCGNSNWFVRNMPTQESLRANRFLSPFANRILAPELWRLTRRSVPRGVALGRSEEHTSELQSLMRISYAVFCLKKKIKRNISHVPSDMQAKNNLQVA